MARKWQGQDGNHTHLHSPRTLSACLVPSGITSESSMFLGKDLGRTNKSGYDSLTLENMGA